MIQPSPQKARGNLEYSGPHGSDVKIPAPPLSAPGCQLCQSYPYLVEEKLASGGLKDKGHLLGRLQTSCVEDSDLAHFQASYVRSSLEGFGLVIQVRA